MFRWPALSRDGKIPAKRLALMARSVAPYWGPLLRAASTPSRAERNSDSQSASCWPTKRTHQARRLGPAPGDARFDQSVEHPSFTEAAAWSSPGRPGW